MQLGSNPLHFFKDDGSEDIPPHLQFPITPFYGSTGALGHYRTGKKYTLTLIRPDPRSNARIVDISETGNHTYDPRIALVYYIHLYVTLAYPENKYFYVYDELLNKNVKVDCNQILYEIFDEDHVLFFDSIALSLIKDDPCILEHYKEEVTKEDIQIIRSRLGQVLYGLYYPERAITQLAIKEFKPGVFNNFNNYF